ncbi:DUF4112 domain-containing protein [soil metagenome]
MTTTKPASLKHVEVLSKLMDNRFKVPGTDIRFGLDGIIGLIPGVGDLAGFAVSAYLITIMSKNGASGFVLARMMLNVIIDTALGMVPVVGDIFDFAFKSNVRNMRLMNEYYEEGKHRGSARKVIVPLLILLFLIVAAITWLGYKLVVWLF